MPIYQYRCLECGEVSELLLPDLSASRTLTCSTCESCNLEKLISAPSLLYGQPVPETLVKAGV